MDSSRISSSCTHSEPYVQTMNHNSTTDLVKRMEQKFNKDLSQNLVVIYGRKGCMKTHELSAKLICVVNERILIVSIDENGKDEETEYLRLFEELLDTTKLPLVFIKQEYVGGTDQVLAMLDGELSTLEKLLRDTLVYDVCVIGGGTCGLKAALEASKDMLVALVDFNMSTIKENEKGLGTASKLLTELLPKYLLHKKMSSIKQFKKINTLLFWEEFIIELHWKMRKLAEKNLKLVKNNNRIRYFDGRVEILDSHSVRVTQSSGFSHVLTAKKLIIATGTELMKENMAGSDVGKTTEQLFQMKKSPGKTLIIGDTLKCLELGGLLGKMGVNCVVITNGTCKVFDQDLLNQVVHMEKIIGVKFLLDYKVTHLTKDGENIRVQCVNSTGKDYMEMFNTVLFANNRRGRSNHLGLSNVGLMVSKTNNKIIAKTDGRTNNPSVFVTGSVLDGPHICSDNATHIQHAINLVRRFQNKPTEEVNSTMVPRVALTPREYGAIGDTEETAVALFGEDNIKIYQAAIGDLFIKIVCVKDRQDSIIGVHILAPRAADLMQSFVTCMVQGITKSEINILQFTEKKIDKKSTRE